MKVIIGGKKSYKPGLRTIANALRRKLELHNSLSDEAIMHCNATNHDEFLKVLYLWIRFCNKMEYFAASKTAEEIQANFMLVELILKMLCFITPHELLHMFPPEKCYDGVKYGMKDYFTTMEAICKFELDAPIDDEDVLLELLWDYQNNEICNFMVCWMTAISHMRQLNGGRDPLEEFMEQQGVPTYTFHEKEGYLYNRRTGETVKISKSKKRKPKYISIIQ